MTDQLVAAAGPLLSRVCTWTARNWEHRTAAGATRAEVVATAVQRLADLAADAEGQPHRAVPPLPGQTGAGLGDQLAVMVSDLARTADPVTCAAAAGELTRCSATLRAG